MSFVTRTTVWNHRCPHALNTTNQRTGTSTRLATNPAVPRSPIREKCDGSCASGRQHDPICNANMMCHATMRTDDREVGSSRLPKSTCYFRPLLIRSDGAFSEGQKHAPGTRWTSGAARAGLSNQRCVTFRAWYEYEYEVNPFASAPRRTRYPSTWKDMSNAISRLITRLLSAPTPAVKTHPVARIHTHKHIRATPVVTNDKQSQSQPALFPFHATTLRPIVSSSPIPCHVPSHERVHISKSTLSRVC